MTTGTLKSPETTGSNEGVLNLIEQEGVHIDISPGIDVSMPSLVQFPENDKDGIKPLLELLVSFLKKSTVRDPFKTDAVEEEHAKRRRFRTEFYKKYPDQEENFKKLYEANRLRWQSISHVIGAIQNLPYFTDVESLPENTRLVIKTLEAATEECPNSDKYDTLDTDAKVAFTEKLARRIQRLFVALNQRESEG